MKIAIMYESHTGNTKLLADAIKDEVKDSLVYIGKPDITVDADLYVVGSWTDKGTTVGAISDLLMMLRDKKIAYFCTAGFGESKQYTDKIIERAESFIDPSNDIVGAFACLGKMPLSVRERYVSMIHENKEDARVKVLIENFDKALTHPDETDLNNVKIWIRDIIKKIKK